MTLPQQMKDNREKLYATYLIGRDGETTKEWLDTLTTSTWNAAQEEMLERAIAKVSGLEHTTQAGYLGYEENDKVHDETLGEVLAALSSLRAGESTKV